VKSPQIIHGLVGVFHYKTHPFWGTIIFGNTQIYVVLLCASTKFQLNDDNKMLHEMMGLSQNIRETQLKNKFDSTNGKD